MPTAEDNRRAIADFYAAFAERDGDAMAAHYAPGATFHDPAFGDLSGEEAGDMWRMLTGRSKDLKVEFSGVDANDTTGKAHWVATYSFGPSQRKVVNVIDAEFRFKDGLIVDHKDTFDFYKWTRMALGPAGMLLGWTPIIQNKVRAQAMDGLNKFQASRP